jgi:hypothetical protein
LCDQCTGLANVRQQAPRHLRVPQRLDAFARFGGR